MRTAPGEPPSVRVLVFDWDQTLWDSWPLHREAIAYVARRAGGIPVPPPEAIVARFGGTLEEHLAHLFGQRDRALLDYYLEFYHAHWREMGRLFPGVREVLQALRQRGYALALLSNKARRDAEPEVAHAGMTGLFHTTLFGDDVGAFKPQPQGLLHLLERLDTPPREALYVGDTPADVHCARGAGARAAGALWGCLDPHALRAAAPDLLWHHPQEALQLPAP